MKFAPSIIYLIWFCVSAALAAENGSVGQSWPVFRGNAQATGVSESPLPDNPELLWKYAVEKGSFDAAPVIAAGVVYIGDLDGTVYAIDLATGGQNWKFTNPAKQVGFNAAAAAHDGLLYVGDQDGTFFCLDGKTGRQKWTFKTEAEINSAANFYHDNVLFGSQDSTLYCLDAKTGRKLWTHSIGNQIRCSPTVVEGRCFIAGCDGKLHVIDLKNGEESGTVDIESPTGSTPAAARELIYFGTEGATFFCINWKELKEVWRWEDQLWKLPLRSSAALTGGAVIFGGRDKSVHALNPKSGEPLWQFTTKGRVDGSPVVAGKRVFIGSADGRIYGLDLNTGQQVWQYEAGGSFLASPAIAAGRMVIASDDGIVYCFGTKK